MTRSFTVDGRAVPFTAGQSVGAALWAAGVRTVRTTRGAGAPRGVFCGIGVCFDCLAEIDGEPDQRACLTPAAAGMVVRVQRGAAVPKPSTETGTGAPESIRTDVVVVGGGPAGMAAAAAAVAAGARVVLLDSGARLGGQYWRHGPEGVGSYHHGLDDWRALDGTVRSAVAAGHLEHRGRHQVWRIDPDSQRRRVVVHATAGCPGLPDGAAERPVTVLASAVVVATGAHDRVLPFPGWDLPGVLTAGGAQAMLKEHGVAAGHRVVVAGTGPFLLSLAAGLLQAGAGVAAVVEAGDGRGWARRWRTATAVPQVLIEAAGYARALARQRVAVRPRHAVVAALGRDRLEAVEVARLTGDGHVVPGSVRRIRCDALAVGWGFRPRLELAQQAGCAVGVSSAIGPEAPAAVVSDAEGRTGVVGVFVAGEVGGVGGASLAQVTGRLAGRAAAAHATGAVGAPEGADLVRRRRLAAFAATMHAAHPVPVGWLDPLTDAVVVCRCEEVDAGAVRSAVRDLGAGDLRTVKLLTRCGMGWCQGRVCGDGVSRLVAAATGRRAVDLPDTRPVASPPRLASLVQSSDELRDPSSEEP